MKKVIFLMSFLLVIVSCFSQKSQLKEIDSLKVLLNKTTVDTTKIDLLNRLSTAYYYIDSKKSLQYAKSIYSLSKKNKLH
ncbi:hypothetical protein [Flavobacterium taihuense]|uniref:Lipoprotein n=1 Tax=Flavobacterium taihuense TaxID=2857508 RepID=A0ABS6XVQ6_9FLAO|nr:hypothetical protein [Flavobacterium taihuense]MBW4359959.1 hypothetical protein [Flavobacterium taihuense]